jgi:membrane-associated phospholipid phosphatase
MKFPFYILFILFSFSIFSQNNEEGEKCSLCKTGEHLHISPYDFSFKKEMPFVLTGVSVLVTSGILNKTTRLDAHTEEEVLALDRNDVNAFDRPTTYNYDPQAAQLSDFFRLGVLVMPALFLTNHHTRQDIKGLTIMTIEVIGINYGVTNSVKFLVNRTRPYVYNDNTPMDVRTDPESRLSFFSGHSSHTAAVSFLFAKVINDYHPDLTTSRKIALWGVAGTIPAVAAYLRVKSGKHFPTDVMSGYAIGATIGWLVPHLHKVKSRINLSSYSFREANGLSFTYKF